MNEKASKHTIFWPFCQSKHPCFLDFYEIFARIAALSLGRFSVFFKGEKYVRHLLNFLFIFLFSFLSFGCEPPPVSPPPRPSQTLASIKPPDVSNILKSGVELREERLYLVELDFRKSELTLDPMRMLKNNAAATQQTLIVDERTFDSYKVDQELSSKFDTWGLLSDGGLASYKVTVRSKQIERQYFWVSNEGIQEEMNEARYKEALRELKEQDRSLLVVPFAGVDRTYVLDRPLADYGITTCDPLQRYFVTILVKNESFSLDLTKYLRNAATSHELTLEVPKQVYDQIERDGQAWEPKVNKISLLLKGRISELRGTVIKRWTETDVGYRLAHTQSGRDFIVPVGQGMCER